MADYSDAVHQIYQSGLTTDRELTEQKLLDLLMEILQLNPTKPVVLNPEFQAIDFLFWEYDKHYYAPPTVNVKLQQRFPLNSHLLVNTRDPNFINAILFQMWCYLHPRDPAKYSQPQIIHFLQQYQQHKPIDLPHHEFQYSRDASDQGTLVISVDQTKHILSY